MLQNEPNIIYMHYSFVKLLMVFEVLAQCEHTRIIKSYDFSIKTLKIEGMHAIIMLNTQCYLMLKDKSLYMKAYEITFFSIKCSYV